MEAIDNDDDDESSEADGMDNSSGSEDDLDDLGEDNDEVIDDELVDKFIRTFHNGDYDAEFDVALSVDRSVTVPNGRPTQASYNKPDNWVERNRIGFEKVKRQLQDWIEAVSHGSSFGIYLNHNSAGYYHDTLMDNEEPIVWHEPILDEFWDELEEAVQQDVAPDIQEVCIDNVEITKESMSKLVAIFTATNSCAYARFDNVNLCEVGIVSLSKLVDASSKLTNCFIRHNRMHNMESVCCLSRSLKSHTCINQLHLTHCELGGNPEILLVILQSDVECITLSNNNIDSLGTVWVEM